ncbi:ROK family protein [Persicitalea jodogahamensis]|uniref:Sugar kinase n=1 Tax=Persicitalea jodogahamensis TaxID=402147 RepID=A0A8J3D4U9_9BACT|nr:ROK family protein [Persicitalea jodogahamensis]GHB75690.1 sugar kinase [Persicitalea jodogahamensis]
MSNYWGIDLGGTKIEGVILTKPSPDSVIFRHRIDTEAQHGYHHIVSRIITMVKLMQSETGLIPEKLGVGTPGTVDPSTRTMKNCNTTCLNGQPLLDDLQKALGFPVMIANDANCFALAEAQMGIVQDVIPNYRLVFGIIMGTGVGGGIVIRGNDGKAFVLNGLQGVGGEWGHNVLEEGGDPCYCGKNGCVEQVLSGPALQRFYKNQSGESLKLPVILERHLAGTDPHATATIERLLEKFGQGLTTLTNVLDPDAIVVGGGVGNIDLLYTEGPKRAEKYVFNPTFTTPILRPKLGDSAGVFGAAMLTM